MFRNILFYAKAEFDGNSVEPMHLSPYINPRQLLDGAGVPPFKYKERDGTSVHKLTSSDGRNFFLKRYPGPTWRKIVKRILLRQWPASMASDEYRAAKLLQSRNIPILNAVAWGEKRVLGLWPTTNFILSEEVKGVEVIDMIRQRDADDVRMRILAASAALAAKIHSARLFFPFRPKDLLCLNDTASGDEAFQLVIIDPDVKGTLLKPMAFSEDLACQALSYSAYLMLRSHIQLNSPQEYRTFIRSYKKTLQASGITLSKQFGRLFKSHLNARLTLHYEDPFLATILPHVPRHLLLPLDYTNDSMEERLKQAAIRKPSAAANKEGTGLADEFGELDAEPSGPIS